MGLKDVDGEITGHRYNHQWHEEVVATGNLSNQEDTRQGGMHHTRHHTRHTQQRKILLRYIDANLMDVP